MPDSFSPEQKTEIFRKCRYSLTGHPRKTPAQVLKELSQDLSGDEVGDFYGKGRLIEDFEKKVAGVLGFPSAVFMPSGTMAQPIALRIWADRKKSQNIAFHPKSHLELHEHRAYSSLHHLAGVLLGNPNQPLKLQDIRECALPLAAVLIELPQREIGGVLPSWEELQAISVFARERGIALHLDGARLWESQPYYGCGYDEIANLFDSVYVSFYKGIGGIAGAILAGDERFIAEARIWQRRQGGNLISLFPYVISAERNFDSRIQKMAEYRAKAVEVARILGSFPGVTITPESPHTNMMHVHIQAPLESLNEASFAMARDYDVSLFRGFSPTAIPHIQMCEVHTGDSTLEISGAQLEEWCRIFFRLLH